MPSSLAIVKIAHSRRRLGISWIFFQDFESSEQIDHCMQNNSQPQTIFTVNEQHFAPSWASVKSRIIPPKQQDGFRLSSASHGRGWLSVLSPVLQLSGCKQASCKVPLGHSSPAWGSPQISAALEALIRRETTSGYSSALSLKTTINPPKKLKIMFHAKEMSF